MDLSRSQCILYTWTNWTCIFPVESNEKLPCILYMSAYCTRYFTVLNFTFRISCKETIVDTNPRRCVCILCYKPSTINPIIIMNSQYSNPTACSLYMYCLKGSSRQKSRRLNITTNTVGPITSRSKYLWLWQLAIIISTQMINVERLCRSRLVGWLVFNGTFSTKRLYHAIGE